jgi:hypothetical protein
MMERDEEDSQVGSAFSWLLRGIISINMLRFSLGWSTWFEDGEHNLGMVDSVIFKPGWRVSGRLPMARLDHADNPDRFLLAIGQAENLTSARIDALRCGLELIGFVLYMAHILLTGLLDFG